MKTLTANFSLPWNAIKMAERFSYILLKLPLHEILFSHYLPRLQNYLCCPLTLTEVLCPVVHPPQHGQVTGAVTRRVGDAITFTCSPGFVARGHALAFCTHDGVWSHPVPQCKSRGRLGGVGQPAGDCETVNLRYLADH